MGVRVLYDIWLGFIGQLVCCGTASVHLCCVYEGQGQGDAACALECAED